MALASVEKVVENATKNAKIFGGKQLSIHGKQLTISLFHNLLIKFEEKQIGESKIAWSQNAAYIEESSNAFLDSARKVVETSNTSESTKSIKSPEITDTRNVLNVKRTVKSESTNLPEPSRNIKPFQWPKVKGITEMVPVTPIPEVNHWTSIKHNINTPDSTFLTHLPQVKRRKDTNKYYSSLLELYHGQLAQDYGDFRLKQQSDIIHAMILGMTALVNEFGLEILSSRFKSTVPMPSASRIAKLSRHLVKDQDSPIKAEQVPQEVFVAITLAVDGTGTAKQLQDWFMEKSGFGSVSTLGEGEIYRALFCKICYLYDCPTHKGVAETCTIENNTKTTSAVNGESSKSGRTSESKSHCEVSDCVNKGEDNLDDGKKALKNNVRKSLEKPGTGTPEMNGKDINPTVGTPNSPQPGTSNGAEKTHKRVKEHIRTLPVKTVVLKPCSHKGICSKLNNCSCVINGVSCEKFCSCPKDCKRKFTGCTCSTTCSTEKCPCFLGLRECDPDLCVKCRSHKLKPEERTCRNVAMQLGEEKLVLQAVSTLVGWGAFAGSDICKGEFISEYVGEIISNEEADKRGFVYDAKKHTYLFGINAEHSLDGTVVGRMSRFINSSETPNCEPKSMRVNGELRIGIYAKDDIKKGDELFFNYQEVLNKLSVMIL